MGLNIFQSATSLNRFIFITISRINAKIIHMLDDFIRN
ncbi:hypothetical protein DBT_2015 [Dissulfuribacter thermophilus]|uniref:Uncharacterized protein n=1 Tax=Dissulfuribacter thermophilus TaxID=1156395 RepID=A0A1B9F3R2_9BACT|nr:hypothetical protein DBT_2015 [Dissulfuribacter thermophilus]